MVLTTFLSLDGVMQAPGGPEEDTSGGFEQGGWLVPFFDEDGGKFIDEVFGSADSFLLGRKTYQIFAAYWPQVTDENNLIATKLNALPKYVASTTLDTVDWNNSTLIKGDVAEEVTKLKQQPGNELQIHGSATLAQTLMEHDLIDKYHLLFFPVVLGTGKRLFVQGAVPQSLKLTDSRTTSTGVAINTYQPAGKPTYGSFI